jgi:hypothetical protein
MASDITPAVGDGTRRTTYAELADIRGQSSETDRPDKRTFERALDILSAQVERELARADTLYARLTEARASERHALGLVKHITAEASEQRKRADDARAEAAGLRTKLDELQARGWWARLRNK